jgi:hypothetical protein
MKDDPPPSLGALGLRKFFVVATIGWGATTVFYVPAFQLTHAIPLLVKFSALFWTLVAAVLVYGIIDKRQRLGHTRATIRPRTRSGRPSRKPRAWMRVHKLFSVLNFKGRELLEEVEEVIELWGSDLHRWAEGTGNPNWQTGSQPADFGWLASKYPDFDASTQDFTLGFRAAMERLRKAQVKRRAQGGGGGKAERKSAKSTAEARSKKTKQRQKQMKQGFCPSACPQAPLQVRILSARTCMPLRACALVC